MIIEKKWIPFLYILQFRSVGFADFWSRGIEEGKNVPNTFRDGQPAQGLGLRWVRMIFTQLQKTMRIIHENSDLCV